MKKICEVEYCQYFAKYALYKTYLDGIKKWLQVCRLCEKEIGDENMRRAGGRYEQTN